MKKITQVLLFAFVAIILAACGDKESSTANAKEENVVVNIANLGYSVLNVAKESGALEEELAKHNATFDFSLHQAGPPINEGIASKRVDFAVLGEGALVGGAANNLDTKLVSLFADGKSGLNAIISTKASGVTKVEELKGKKIAVGFGTAHHVFLLKVLDSAGLTADDVTLVNLTIPDAHPAFQTNQIDAWVTAELYSNIEAANGAVLIANGAQFDLYSPIFFVARGEFAKEHPELVEAILRAIDKTIDFAKTDNAAYYELAAKSVNQEVALVQAAESFEPLNAVPSSEIIEQFQESADILKSLGFVSTDIDIASLIDTTYIESIRK